MSVDGTDPDILAEFVERVVLREQDRVLDDELGEVLSQVSNLIDRAENIVAIRQGPLGVSARAELGSLLAGLTTLAEIWSSPDVPTRSQR